jgi:two-component system sensor histidine kinase KdpD
MTNEEEAVLLTRYSAMIAGPVAAVTVAGALVGVRDSLGVTNVGLVMVLVVLLTAVVGGRTAGILTAVTAALAFSYFHTQPYLSFAVAARQDLIAVVLLACVALVAAEVGSRAQLYNRELRRRRATDEVLEGACRKLASGAVPEDVFPEVERRLVELSRSWSEPECF